MYISSFPLGCFEDKCYTIFTPSHGLNWHESQSKCVEWGGNLASIESNEENEFILENLSAYDKGNCWIGLNDVEEEAWDYEADFTWIDGSISTYRLFETGEPNDWDNSEDCVHLLDKTTPKSWNDGRCSTKLRCYICKMIGRLTFGVKSWSKLDFPTPGYPYYRFIFTIFFPAHT